jgi:flagellar protein FliO/FliZ
MTSSFFPVVLFLVMLACVPLVLKWLRTKSIVGGNDAGAQSKIISALAVGPHQRVITVEVGLEAARVRLTLGVTPQAISLLHSAPVPASRQALTSPASDVRSHQ